MFRHQTIYDRALWPIDVVLDRRSHTNHFENGALVKASFDLTLNVNLNEQVFDQQGYAVAKHFKRVEKNSAGIVLGKAWHVDPLDLRSGMNVQKLQGPSVQAYKDFFGKLYLRDAYIDLYYNVLFSEGPLWARFDHIEPVDH